MDKILESLTDLIDRKTQESEDVKFVLAAIRLSNLYPNGIFSLDLDESMVTKAISFLLSQRLFPLEILPPISFQGRNQ